jgi:hypothetical protein
MYTIKFITNNLSRSTLYIGYKEKYIEETVNNKISWFTNWQPHELEEKNWENNS